MSLRVRLDQTIPSETARIAHASFPKGNLCIRLRDELGPIYTDAQFSSLFELKGPSGESPAQLTLVLILQHLYGLSDRQAAEAVRARIDWKYLLNLELDDSGFDYSVLSEFRSRLIAGNAEMMLLDRLLALLKEQGLIKERGKQRTDSTGVLAAVRKLNRIEFVTESLRRALDDVAGEAPDWLRSWVPSAWFDRYSVRSESYRLPTKEADQAAWKKQVGEDGYALLNAIYTSTSMGWLKNLNSVVALRLIWLQQYYQEEGDTRLRRADVEGTPAHGQLIVSPDDLDARNRTKRETNWTGYAVQLTESCDPDAPHLITHVETTPATVADATMLPIIHQALAEKGLLPAEHLVDTAYVSANQLVASQEIGIDLIGPVPADNSWQTRTPDALNINVFALDWAEQVATCPQGQTSIAWHNRRSGKADAYVEIHFPVPVCTACPVQEQCTRSKKGNRVLRIQPEDRFEALQKARQRQQTQEFKDAYQQRAGIEGTVSQSVRRMDIRHARYIGQPKVRLQHIFTAIALNFARVFDWLDERPRAKTRTSRFAALAAPA